MPLICPHCNYFMEELDYIETTTIHGRVSANKKHLQNWNADEDEVQEENTILECLNCNYRMSLAKAVNLIKIWQDTNHGTTQQNQRINEDQQLNTEIQSRIQPNNNLEAKEAINPHKKELNDYERERYDNIKTKPCDSCGNPTMIEEEKRRNIYLPPQLGDSLNPNEKQELKEHICDECKSKKL